MRERPWFTARVKRLQDIIEPMRELARDAELAEIMLKENDTQYLRRCYARAVFSLIEGAIYTLKQGVIGFAASLRPPGHDILDILSVSEIAMLQEYSIDLANNGKPIIRQKFLKLPDNIKFTAEIISRLFNCSIDLNIKGKEWGNFLKAIQIRHRITHPKNVEEFQITDDEIKVVREVSSWFIRFLKSSILAIKIEMEKYGLHISWPSREGVDP